MKKFFNDNIGIILYIVSMLVLIGVLELTKIHETPSGDKVETYIDYVTRTLQFF